jgi:ABC-type glycerol-3-phosphate transport system permease component
MSTDPMSSERQRRRGTGLIWLAICLLVGLLFFFPILWAALMSFKSTPAIIAERFPLTWKSVLPTSPTIDNYVTLFTSIGFGRSLLNTMIASLGQVSASVIVATLAGYAFARLRFPGRDLLFALILSTAFVPLETILVPLYNVARALGLTSTYPALFLPFIANPFGIYLMRQSFAEIPVELDDAAHIDGASRWRVFWRIALPNVKPALATLVLIQFIWSWNNYLWPLVIIQNPNMQIAQVSLAALKSIPNFPMDGPLFAGATILTVPLVLLAIVLQRYYVRGLMTSGIR